MRIPMNEYIRALNVSNSACVMIYEALRQQNFHGLSMVEPFKGENWLTEE